MPRANASARRPRAEEIQSGMPSFQTLVAAAGAPIIVFDQKGLIREFNPAAERLHGYRRDEVLGERYLHLFVPEERQAALRSDVRRILDGDTGHDLEVTIRTRDGNTRVISWSGARVHDDDGTPNGMIGVGQDVTARAQAERALRESEHRFRELADAAPVLVWMADAAYQCTYVNQAWLDFTGLSRQALLGDAWAELIHPEDHERSWPGYVDAIQRRVEFTMDHRLRSADGSYRWIFGKASPRYDADGTFAGFVGCSIDITERRRAEEALQQTNDELEQRVARRTAELSTMIRELRNEAADRKNAASRLYEIENELAHALRMSTMGELAAEMAHELHQPLTAVVNYAGACAELVRAEESPNPELIQYLEQIGGQTLRAGKIIQRLRGFIGKKAPEPKPLAIAKLIEETAPLLAGEAKHRGVELFLVLPDTLPLVLGDQIQLQQVVVNLVSNALEAASDPQARAGRVRIEAAAPHGSDVIEVRVSDTGPGLSAEAADRAFEPFFSTKPTGMGFGLSISRSIAEAHGGALVVRQTSSKGATFCLALPVHHSEGPPA